MRYGYRNFLSLAMLVGVIAIAGCGGGEEESSDTPTASIDNSPKQEASAQSDDPAEPNKAPLHPMVKIDTSYGAITVKLDEEKAELTVENFLQYVDAKHYDKTIFHQIYRSQGIVGGGFTAEFIEKETPRTVYNEAHNGLQNRRGTIAMARRSDDIHSAACQFFINVTDNPELDHKDHTLEGYGYCVFGEVVEGMAVVDKIGNCEVHDTDDFEQTPVQTVLIKSVRRVQ